MFDVAEITIIPVLSSVAALKSAAVMPCVSKLRFNEVRAV